MKEKCNNKKSYIMLIVGLLIGIGIGFIISFIVLSKEDYFKCKCSDMEAPYNDSNIVTEIQ